MVQIAGTYKLESQENFKEYLMSLGLDDEKASKVASSTSDLVIKGLEGDKLVMTYENKEVTFTLNKEEEHEVRSHKVWTTASVNGDTITFKTKFNADGSFSEEKVFKITDTGLTGTSTTSKGAKCVRTYKRV